jgi:hypothetical protein
MTNTFLNLLPMILGTALAPIWIILVLLMLRSPNGLLKALAFVAGATTVRLVQGILFGYVLGAAKAVEGEAGGPSPVVSTLLLAVGILLLITAIKTLGQADDPDDPPPKWMKMVDSATPLQTFGLGAIFTLVAAKLWVLTLSAIGVIRENNLNSSSDNILTFLIYVVGAEALLILPVLIYAITPRQSARLLRSTTDWLERYNRPITIAVSSIFGCFFLWKGISGLLL